MEKKIKRIKPNWMDFIILKALSDSERKELMSSELKLFIKQYCEREGIKSVTRIFLHQRLEKLVEWNLIEKVKSVENIYILNPRHVGHVESLCFGFFGIIEKKEGLN